MGSVVYALALVSFPTDYRYIGKTSAKPSHRLSQHLSLARKDEDKTHLYNWLRKATSNGETIEITILEDNLTFPESGTREIFLIDHYKQLGFNLTNATLGGEGTVGSKHTQEARAKISLARIGNTYARGFKHTQETNLRNSLARKTNTYALGHIVTPETRLKLSLAQTGKIMSPESIAKGVATKKRNKLLKEEARLAGEN